MKIYLTSESVVFGTSVPLGRFPALYAEFIRRYPNTLDLETTGAQLIESGFLETEIEGFVRSVCEWGGYAGVGGRVLRHNTIPHIREAFSEALSRLRLSEPDCKSALSAMNGLYGLGTPSFASKHLRFLRPAICPVYDAILKVALPYSFDADGYGEFASDCAKLVEALSEAGIEHPKRNNGWYAADVEAVLFAHVNKWLTSQQ